jgi:uncharacterized protein (TIGR03492 family)
VKQKVLFISNGHGEDLNSCLILKALNQQQPGIELAAMPVVGEGNAYRQLGVNIIGPTKSLPSGGFIYMNYWRLVEDIFAGLLSLLSWQIKAVQAYSKDCTAIFATGDIVVLFMAYLTGKPFTAFLVSTSAYYEGRNSIPLISRWFLRSSRCQIIFTRDQFTAEILQRDGFNQAIFAGYPVMDALVSTSQNLYLSPAPMVALLAGSRLPESLTNLEILLDVAIATCLINSDISLQFRLAITPDLLETDAHGMSLLQLTALKKNWQDLGEGWLFYAPHQIKIYFTAQAFSDILKQSSIVVGMAGTAIEQAVGLGKPVIQIPNVGPQFTYRFAEAQMRLLGESVQTIGKNAATPQTIRDAAQAIHRTLLDQKYLQRCQVNGLERVGQPGGSVSIAQTFYRNLQNFSIG